MEVLIMPKYKDSPEVRAAKKERKEKLREFLQLLDVEDYSDLRSVFKEMVGEVLENGLEAELDDTASTIIAIKTRTTAVTGIAESQSKQVPEPSK